MFGANLWHWSHFLTYSWASFYIPGHQYPWVMALCNRDLPPVWLPQIPSWNSSSSNSNALGCIHSKYCPEYEHLYNLWSSDSQNWGTFLHIFSASDFSSGSVSSLRKLTIGSIQLGPTLTWWIWTMSSLTPSALRKSSMRMTRGKPYAEEVARVANESACVFPFLEMCDTSKDSKSNCKCLT